MLLLVPFSSLTSWTGTALHSRPHLSSSSRVGILTLSEKSAAAAITRYFEAWNARDMDAACAQFADECEYEDTQYAGAFTGKEALKAHLNKCADNLPPSFKFCIDEVADGGSTVGVQWHVENNGQPLPFTRGCSLYKADPETGLLVSGFDVPEPAPFKPGSASLLLLGLASKLIAEPVRAIPLVAWGAYVSIVFFSNGILPGPDATQLDPATWDEVLGLSLNFWSAPRARTAEPLPEALRCTPPLHAASARRLCVIVRHARRGWLRLC